MYYSTEELNKLQEEFKDNTYQIYHLRRNSYPTIITKDSINPNKLTFTLNMAKDIITKPMKKVTSNKKNQKEASGIKGDKSSIKDTPATHPKEGKTEMVLEDATGTSGTEPELINSAAQLSLTSGENAVNQDAEKPGNNNVILLPYEEDSKMAEPDSPIDNEMEEVEKYFDSLPTENPSLESSIKNSYGGSGPIASYNNDNPGATVLLANNAMFQEMQKHKYPYDVIFNSCNYITEFILIGSNTFPLKPIINFKLPDFCISTRSTNSWKSPSIYPIAVKIIIPHYKQLI